MRDIKFRVWHKGHKNWINNDPGTHCWSSWMMNIFTGEIVDFVCCVGSERYSREPEPNFYMDKTKPVKESPFIVQQYTGLKDKNGIEIYEGDCVKITNHRYILADGQKEEDAQYVVEWGGIGFDFRLLNGYFMQGCGRNSEPEYEVIGNIFENPELLK